MVFLLDIELFLTHKELAELLQISEGTSKSQLARARYLLQDLITANEKGTKQNEAIAK